MTWRRMRTVPVLVLLCGVHLAAFGGSTISGYDPAQQFRERPLMAPSATHILGTDALGRDVLARTLAGLRTSVVAAWLGTVLAVSLGVAVGLVGGYAGGWVDGLLLRVGDLLLSVPWMYLLLAVRAALPLDLPDRDIHLAMAALLGGVGWVASARSVRAEARQLVHAEWVLALKVAGATPARVLQRLLAHVMPVAITHALLLAPQFVIAESTLSFLGLGAGDASPSLGTLLAPLQRPTMLAERWWLVAPAVTLVAVVLLYHRAADLLPSRQRSAMLMP